MNTKSIVLGICGIVIAVVLGYLALTVFSDDEKDRLEKWLYAKAEEIPKNRAEDFLGYVDLEKYGFRMQIRSSKSSFAGKDRDKFITRSLRYAKILQGSKLDLHNIEIEFNDKVAKVKMLVKYQAKEGSGSFVKQVVVDVEMKIVVEESGYKVAYFSAAPSRNPMGALL